MTRKPLRVMAAAGVGMLVAGLATVSLSSLLFFAFLALPETDWAVPLIGVLGLAVFLGAFVVTFREMLEKFGR